MKKIKYNLVKEMVKLKDRKDFVLGEIMENQN